MRNRYRTILLATTVLLFALSCSRDKSNIVIGIEDIGRNDKVLVLMHPTENNIKTFNYLIENRILQILSKVKVIGV